MSFDTSQRLKRSLSFADHVSATKRLRNFPTTDNEELEEFALNDSHASTMEQVLQLLAAVAQASETVIPIHAIEDKGMNFQM